MNRSSRISNVIAAIFVTVALGGAASAQQADKPAKPAKPAKGAKPEAKPATPPAPPPLQVDVVAERKTLLGTDVDAAAASAQKLGLSRQPGALDSLLDALSMGLHPKVAVAALEALANHRDAKSLDVLLYYARNRNAEVRARAIVALGTLEDKRARNAVYEAFTDGSKEVRGAAIKVAETREDKGAIETLLALMQKGDEGTVSALATVGNANVARQVAELAGDAPDNLVAETLGKLALRKNLGGETVYVEIIRTIGKIPGDEAVAALSAYISAAGEKEKYRQSVREAQMLYEQRIGGGQ